MTAVVALGKVSAKCSATALHDSFKGFLLYRAKGVLFEKCICMASENISKLSALAFIVHGEVF